MPETATLFFGDTISTSQVLELCRDVLAEGLSHARDGADWPKVSGTVDRAARDLRLTFPQDVVRLAVNQIAPSSAFFPALETLKEELRGMIAVLETQAARAETLEQCRVRAIEIAGSAAGGAGTTPGKGQRCQTTAKSACCGSGSVFLLRCNCIKRRFVDGCNRFFNKQREGVPRTWIFTSAPHWR